MTISPALFNAQTVTTRCSLGEGERKWLGLADRSHQIVKEDIKYIASYNHNKLYSYEIYIINIGLVLVKGRLEALYILVIFRENRVIPEGYLVSLVDI